MLYRTLHLRLPVSDKSHLICIAILADYGQSYEVINNAKYCGTAEGDNLHLLLVVVAMSKIIQGKPNLFSKADF